MNLNRLELLIGKDKIDKIKNTKVLLVGIGGVGGYTFESLVRSGIENITIIDGDKIDETNLNRRILTNSLNIGKYKVDEARVRALSINPNININVANLFLDETNIDLINFKNYDYIIDACDTVSTKSLLIYKGLENKVKIISSMGTAKKMDPLKLTITTLNKTSYDPLAKAMRKLIDKENQEKVIVISSTEEILTNNTLGSNSFVPGVAGLLITSFIINDIVSN